DGDAVAEDAGVEPPAAEMAHRDALLLQHPRRGLRTREPAQGDGEARGVVAREPPREQPRDAVDARPGHPELVADVKDADRHRSGGRGRVGRRGAGAHTTAPDKDRNTMRPAGTRLDGKAPAARRPSRRK